MYSCTYNTILCSAWVCYIKGYYQILSFRMELMRYFVVTYILLVAPCTLRINLSQTEIIFIICLLKCLDKIIIRVKTLTSIIKIFKIFQNVKHHLNVISQISGALNNLWSIIYTYINFLSIHLRKTLKIPFIF